MKVRASPWSFFPFEIFMLHVVSETARRLHRSELSVRGHLPSIVLCLNNSLIRAYIIIILGKISAVYIHLNYFYDIRVHRRLEKR